MAATQNALSRTRSARVPATTSTRNLTSSSSGATETQATSTVSNISLFLSNLHLLDLDLLPDWPAINALTFTNKDATQGQRKRIQSVEWALYQLFALWDPEEARDKLQPFFPPADQLQSSNLRSALLRSLEQAKKSGILGRDVVVRKTMLDECRGERLEEILAVFSSAVLKKLVAEEHLNTKYHPAIAQSLALEKRGYSGERTESVPLILAHKASLRKKLDQKNAARTQYKDFAKVLDAKERGIASRKEQASAAINQPILSKDVKKKVRRVVRDNWTGNERWMEALLYDDIKSRQDGILAAPFDRVWRRIRTDRLEDLEGKSSSGLLEQLDDRVRVQQERLKKWQDFRREMFDDISVTSVTENSGRVGSQKGIDLRFYDHQSFQLGRVSPREIAGTRGSHHGEYRALLDGLETELKKIKEVPLTRPFKALQARARDVKTSTQSSSLDKTVDEPLSELSELEEDLASAASVDRRPTQCDVEDTAKCELRPEQPSRRARPKLPQPLSTNHVFRPKLQSTEIAPIESSKPRIPSPRRSTALEESNNSPSPARSPTRTHSSAPLRPPSPESPMLRTQSPENLSPSPTQQQADQILASMSAASPSPVKQSRPRHTLSLSERTRLSMVRGATVSLDEDDEVEVASSSPTRSWRRNTSSRSPTKTKPETSTASPNDRVLVGPADTEIAEENTLEARTRRSMANFELTQQKARLERERSLKRAAREQSGSIARHSYFASLDEENVEEAASENATLVLEELIAKEAQGVDYESVFMSRPKIKTSPPSTPARGRRIEEG
ncbi:unnamed protein product [Discula destructiva]